MSRALPIVGTAIALATVAATMKRKGFFGGMLDTGLNAMPFVGAVHLHHNVAFTGCWPYGRTPNTIRMGSPVSRVAL